MQGGAKGLTLALAAWKKWLKRVSVAAWSVRMRSSRLGFRRGGGAGAAA